MAFYAYVTNESYFDCGVVNSWDLCQQRTHGKKAHFRKFENLDQALAFIAQNTNSSFAPSLEENKNQKTTKNSQEPCDCELYFDSGTGFGNGPEVRVTDPRGDSLLHKLFSEKYINENGNYLLDKNMTNNYGELLACFFGLKIALKLGLKHVCGDSKLVLEYWSRGHISKNNSDPYKGLLILARKTALLRSEFEKAGGKIGFVSGAKNKADLGFHK